MCNDKEPQKHPDLLLYVGMGDAYAAGTEYVDAAKHPHLIEEALRFAAFGCHPRHLDIRNGRYTDDTEMSAACVRVLIEHEPPYTRQMFADAFLAEFVRGGKRKGYASGFQAFLETVTSGADLLARIKPESKKGGAAMRSVPFGVIRRVEDAMALAAMQASITHDNAEGRFSARAVALMSNAALYGDVDLADLGEHCLEHLQQEDFDSFGDIFRTPWSGKPVGLRNGGPVSLEIVHAVVDVLGREKSLMGILERVIRWGGDTDTVAAVAWGIASARYRNEPLPPFLVLGLENGSTHTGATYLRDLGTKLMEKWWMRSVPDGVSITEPATKT